MSRIVDLGKSMGRMVAAFPPAMFMPKSVAQAALKKEEAETCGKALGLTDEQIREVITVAYQNSSGRGDFWEQIQQRLILRAMGEEEGT